MSKSQPLPQRWSPGFTLVELVTVMLIVGIMAVVVVPRFGLLKGYDEVGYRDTVKATLEYARKSAVAQRRNVCVALASNGLTLTRDVRDPDTNTADCTQQPTANINRLQLPAPETSNGNEIRPRGSVVLTGTAFLSFSPLGRPSSAASYTVTGTDAYTITVEAETGYVH
jgi:MSHA pilin protein MshC